MRLIDAVVVEERLWDARRAYQLMDNSQDADKIMHGIYNAEQIIREASTVDAVPVVRCKDCKWWVREGNDSYGYAMFCDHDCSLGGQGIKKPTDYCSYGERKGGDGEP